MKKRKLAIFTAAVGFFTLCNVFIYTRRLRADEMARFWNWSSSSFYSLANYNGNRGNSSGGNLMAEACHFALNNSEVLVDPCVPTHHQNNNESPLTNSANSTLDFPSNSSTHNNINNNKNRFNSSNNNNNVVEETANESHTKSFNDITLRPKAYFVLQNQTYIVDLNGTEVYTELLDSKHNRTLTVTFSQSLFVRDDKQLTTTTPATDVPKSAANATAVASNGLTSLNAHPFHYLINVKNLCGRSPLMLVILVATAVEHVAHRQAIRDTWGTFAKTLPDVRLAFVMGRPVNQNAQGILMKEALTHGDIIQEDFMDTYKNLTLKTVMLLKWASTQCSNAAYIMKADDDMFVNVPNLLKYIKSLRQHKLQLFGRLVKGARPLRSHSSKYYVPVSEYKDKVYPDYLSGTSYVMSADVAPKLYTISKSTPMFFFEDVFITGICAKKAGIVRRNHIGFVYYKRPVKGCSYLRVITGHNNTPSDLRKIWKDLQKKVIKC